MSKPTKIIRIVIEDDDVTFYFEGSEEPWGIAEFVPGSFTRDRLEQIEAAIIDFNHPAPPLRWAIGCPSGLHANDGRCDCRAPEKSSDPVETRQNERRHEERVDAEHDWAG